MSNDTNIDFDIDIFQALIEKHEIQRDLCDKLENESNQEERKAIYKDLRLELKAHAAAEERHLYIPVMQHDDGLDLSRHAITEHHEMDEMMETLDDNDTSKEEWDKTCGELIHKVRHHLKEEENEFFKQAREILDADLQQRLGALYQVEHDEYEDTHEES